MRNRHELEAVLRRRAVRDSTLRAVIEAAREVSAEVWLVGGYVRDVALGRPAHDVDLFATSRTVRLVRRLGRSRGCGAFRFRKRGVTTWRLSLDGRQVDLVDASRRGLIEELQRRELTVNAVAFDLVGGRVADPLSGLADLRAGRLRLPRPGVFREDPVRALRAARFLAQFPKFRLAARTREAARAASRGLRRAAPERLRQELDRMLVSRAPDRGLDALADLDLVDAVLPELAPLRRCVAGADRPDVWRHTVDAIAISARPRRLPGSKSLAGCGPLRVLRWSLLLHDVSKPETHAVREDGRPTFHGHEVLGARRADGILRRLLVARSDRRRIVRVIRWHLRPGHLADAGAPERGMRRLVRDAGDDLPLLVFHAACDARASGGPEGRARWTRLRGVLGELLEIRARTGPTVLPQLVDGRDVMRVLRLEPGRRIGLLLARVRDRQEAGKLTTREEALDYLSAITRRAPGGT